MINTVNESTRKNSNGKWCRTKQSLNEIWNSSMHSVCTVHAHFARIYCRVDKKQYNKNNLVNRQIHAMEHGKKVYNRPVMKRVFSARKQNQTLVSGELCMFESLCDVTTKSNNETPLIPTPTHIPCDQKCVSR